MGAQLHKYYRSGVFGLSFEVFPPKTATSTQNLYRVVEELGKWNPAFLSVTYGAGGTTRTQSLEILTELKNRMKVPLTAHFTCVGSTLPEMREWLGHAQALGVENIMALRGDPPHGQETFQATAGGFSHASELVEFIRKEFPGFGIGVAGYPEPHRESTSPESDLLWLKRKVDNGGDAVFTQLFYNNADFFKFRDQCTALGIQVPIVPGILPVLSLDQLRRITRLCGASIPAPLLKALEECGTDTAKQLEVGTQYCIRQCEELRQQGVPGIHFYVLNRSDIIQRILLDLGF